MGKVGPSSEPGRDFVLDIALSLGAALWLAAADALLMMGAPGGSAADYILRPFGRLGLTPASYVLVLFLVLGLAAGLLVGFLQRGWLRTPKPWRQTVSLLVSLGLLLLVLCALRAHRLKDIEAFERYFSGLAVAVVLLAVLALSVPWLAQKGAEGSALYRTGRSAAVLALIVFAGALAAPVVQQVLLPRIPLSDRSGLRPNVLILMLDTVRADALSCVDPASGASPHIDAVAREGTLFRKAIAPAPWTVPSHASLFTGLYPTQHGAVWEHRALNNEFHTLAEVFWQRGYRTVAFSENPNISRSAGFAQGFEDFSELFMDPRRAIVPDLLNRVLDDTLDMPQTLEYTKESVAYLIRWLRGHALQGDSPPFFAFLNLMAGHQPNFARPEFNSAVPDRAVAERVGRLSRAPHLFYLPGSNPEPDDLEVMRQFYKGDIAYLDQRLGRLFDFLREKNLLDYTALVIVSDHGENFGDHGLIEHAFCLYNTVLQVPVIIRYPSKVPDGLVLDDIVSTVHLFNTILELAGVKATGLPPETDRGNLLAGGPDSEVFAESENLAGMLRSVMSADPAAAAFDFGPFDKSLKCLYSGRYKLIVSSKGGPELYDLQTDWAETKNLAASDPARLKQLLEKLLKREKGLVRPGLDFTPPRVDRRVQDALKSLGYVR